MYTDSRHSFDQIADRYDANRRKFIPCFDDFYGCAVEQIPFAAGASPTILDLGAGTGLFSAMVRQNHPNAQITLFDFSEQMLAKARQRFAGDDKTSFIAGDYFVDKLPSGCDVIMSALSIHHLPHEAKRELYRRIFDALAGGGVFINADLVLGASGAVEGHCYNMWVSKMHALGITAEEFSAWRERLAEDRYAPLEDQLNWLREAGFADVDCLYRYYNFSVFTGKKA